MKRAALRSSFLGLFILCIFSKCSGSKSSSSYAHLLPSSKVAYLNIYEDPESLDPRRCRLLKDLTLAKQLFEGLSRLNENEIPELAIAESVEVSEDALCYVFKLKTTIWSDGTPLKAKDFEYAWKKVLDPNFACDYSHMLYPIKNAREAREGRLPIDEVGVKAIDDKTLVVELCEPASFFLELTSFPTFFPIPSHLDEKQSAWAKAPYKKFVSNGPFCLQSQKDQFEIVLAKNPSYWDYSHVYLDALHFSVISDPLTESELYFKGRLDWLGQPFSNNIFPECLTKLKEKKDLHSYPVIATKWIQFNTSIPPFTNLKIRQAFNCAICREEIVSHLLSGQQKIALGILPPGLSVLKTDFFQDANITCAQKLFNEALIEEGWTRETFPKVELLFRPSERELKIFQQIQRQWEECFGIFISLRAVEPKVYNYLVQTKKFQLGPGEWVADYAHPLSFLDFFSDGTMNGTQWKDPFFIEAVKKIHEEKSNEKKKEYIFYSEKRLMEQMPVAPLYHYAFDYAIRGIEDVKLTAQGLADFKSAKKVSTCEDAGNP